MKRINKSKQQNKYIFMYHNCIGKLELFGRYKLKLAFKNLPHPNSITFMIIIV